MRKNSYTQEFKESTVKFCIDNSDRFWVISLNLIFIRLLIYSFVEFLKLSKIFCIQFLTQIGVEFLNHFYSF